MGKLTVDELKQLIENHGHWLREDCDGWENMQADLSGANLSGANLYGADLSGADLYGADLYGANLYGAKNIPYIPITCPDAGAFIAWKKVNGYIVKLQIPEDAKRCSAASRKCRCDKALVLAIETIEGEAADVSTLTNCAYAECVYTVGEMVYPDSLDDNRWNECSHGIHFFVNRQEAVNW